MPNISNFREQQYPATDEVQCIKVYIPAGDEFKQLLAGLLALPGRVENYQGDDEAQADGLAAIWQDAYERTDWDGCGTPPECEQMNSDLLITMDEVQVLSGNAFAWQQFAAQMYGGSWRQSAAGATDNWQYEYYLPAGDWEFSLLYIRGTASGKGNLYITQDFATYQLNQNCDFRGAAAFNLEFTGGFTIPVSGLYKVGFVGTGASSGSSYNRDITKLALHRYDDL